MSERLDKLVKLYAEQSVEQLKSDPTLLEQTFGKSYDELTREWGFPEDQMIVEGLRLHIEMRRARLVTPDKAQQIAECLKMLLRLAMYEKAPKKDRDLKIMAGLFEQMFFGGWSNPQQAHFGYVKEKIKNWSSYFISYTNDGAKAINKRYKAVIDFYVDPEIIKQRKPDEDNLLVEAIVNRLRKRLLGRSFYDKHSIKLGDDLNLKIAPACKSTFAFLQLVQLEIFNSLQDVNWCFEEYMFFQNGNKEEVTAHMEYHDVFRKRFCAILAGDKSDDVRPPGVSFDYEPWSDRIFVDQLYVTLPKNPYQFDDTIRRLADELLNVSFQIIENVPA